MNLTVTPPPEHEPSPATRARQRDELVAIVSHESTAASRRRLVPLLAAASVVAVTAGLAIGVPALRHDSSRPPAAGTDEAVSKPLAQPLTQPLTAAVQSSYAKRCNENWGKDMAKRPFTVVDSFRWANPPQDSRSIAWVLIRNQVMTRSCGFNANGRISEIGFASSGQAQPAVIVRRGAGNGTYTKAVTRITMSIGAGPTTEAVLRNGFFFAPMKYVAGPNPRTPAVPGRFHRARVRRIGQADLPDPEDGQGVRRPAEPLLHRPRRRAGRLLAGRAEPDPGPVRSRGRLELVTAVATSRRSRRDEFFRPGSSLL